MELSGLRQFDKNELLKYLAYLQVRIENSAHTQTLQEIQNHLQRGEDVLADISLWTDLDEVQTWLFVENNICFSACQFRAFVSDATERAWQLSEWIDFMIENNLLTRRELYPVFFFLLLSDKIAEREGLAYYEVGDYKNVKQIAICEVDDRKLLALSFSGNDFQQLGRGIIKDFSFLEAYYIGENNRVEDKPLLKEGDLTWVLSPNALMNSAWREMLKSMKAKYSDSQIQDFYFAALSGKVHQSFASKWKNRKELKVIGEQACTAVYEVFYNQYIAVTITNKKTKELNTDALETDAFESIDVTSHVETVSKKIKEADKDAKIVHIIVPFTIQDETAVLVSNNGDPAIIIKWKPLSVILEKDDDNPLWLFHYICDRKGTSVRIQPDTPEEDVIALYLAAKHSFYLTDKAIPKLDVSIRPGYGLSLYYGILKQANRHAIEDAPFNIVVSRDQECPRDIPFYEIYAQEFDIMVGEYMLSSILLRLPSNSKNVCPEVHAVGKSLLLWYYALEKRFGNPVLGDNLKLKLEQDDSLATGYKIDTSTGAFVVKIGQDIIGNQSTHELEERLLKAVLDEANRGGFVINPAYEALIKQAFEECSGGIIQQLSNNDLIGDSTIGNRVDYVVDDRRKRMIMEELADKFNHYPAGNLSLQDSKDLTMRLIHYLNIRITKLLEELDIEKVLSALHTLRDGLIFWNRTLSERYNGMMTLYRYVGTYDPIQETRLQQFVETDLCARCLIEYITMKCTTHKDKDIMHDLASVDELFALMATLINIGYLSDYYRSPSFSKPIESLPNGKLFYPVFDGSGISKYAEQHLLDRLEHPDLYEKVDKLMPDLDFDHYKDVFEGVFVSEFGLSYEHFWDITNAIIMDMQTNKVSEQCEELPSFKARITKAANVDEKEMTTYIMSFSISDAYRDLGMIPCFKEYDTYPCRYKRKLALICRPFSVYTYKGKRKLSFSYRGFIQSQINLIENIRHSNYSGMTEIMRKHIGKLNKERGHNFEEGIYKLFEKENVLTYRSALISPKKILKTAKDSLGDIDVLLIDHNARKILLVETKYYNECKTPYEAYNYERMILDDIVQVKKRDKWARENKLLFEFYAKEPTNDYVVATVILTYNQVPTKFFSDEYRTDIPIVWVRDVIEEPLTIFGYGEFS